ncbi:MAG: gamma-glutamyltransferase, partial [Lentisphaerae bacterium]|nr:gamma-glutamyltransferase [Lentisphaerota bacterium]
VMAISVAGGDLQDQVALNLLLDVIEFDMPPASAVTAPRFATAHHQDSFNPDPIREQTFCRAGSLSINDSVDPVTQEELAHRGHTIEPSEGPIGAPVMLAIDPATGICQAAGDPVAGRHAAAAKLRRDRPPTLLV